MSHPEPLREMLSLDRRAFMQVSMSGIAVQWLGASALARPVTKAPAVSRCLVGFVDTLDFSELDHGGHAMTQQSVVPAERLTNGDLGLEAQGVCLRFHGIQFPEGWASESLEVLTVDLEMQVGDSAAETIPWHLWTYSNQEVLNVSGEVRANVPLRPDGSLRFSVTVQSRSEPPQQYQIKLTTGSEPGIPKLRTGTYCVSVPDGDSSTPLSCPCLVFTILNASRDVSASA